jgi:hypothetical protein
MHAREAVGQDAAIEVAAQLALDEARETGAALFLGARDQGREVFAQDAVENAPLRLSTLARTARPLSP